MWGESVKTDCVAFECERWKELPISVSARTSASRSIRNAASVAAFESKQSRDFILSQQFQSGSSALLNEGAWVEQHGLGFFKHALKNCISGVELRR
jgi:hypothetical protein